MAEDASLVALLKERSNLELKLLNLADEVEKTAQQKGLEEDAAELDRVIELSNFSCGVAGGRLSTKYGNATLLCVRQDGVAVVELIDWKMADEEPVYVYLPLVNSDTSTTHTDTTDDVDLNTETNSFEEKIIDNNDKTEISCIGDELVLVCKEIEVIQCATLKKILNKSRVDPFELRQKCSNIGGIPSELRSKVYAILLDSYQIKNNDNNENIEIPSDFDDASIEDLRTIDADRLLSYYCVKNAVPYTQGLHEISPFLWLHRPTKNRVECEADHIDETELAITLKKSEGLIYTMFSSFVKKFLPNTYIHSGKDFNCLQASLRFFSLLLQYHDPKLAKFLDQYKLPPFIQSICTPFSCCGSNALMSAESETDGRLNVSRDLLMQQLLRCQKRMRVEGLGRCGGHICGVRRLCESARHLLETTPRSFTALLNEVCYSKSQPSATLLKKLERLPCLEVLPGELVRNAEEQQREREVEAGNIVQEIERISVTNVGVSQVASKCKYFVMDCRSVASYDAAHFSISYRLSPDLLDEGMGELSEILDSFSAMKECNLCFVGDALDLNKKESVGSKARTFIKKGYNDEDDDAVKWGVSTRFALLFLQRGFSKVAIVPGGFPACLRKAGSRSSIFVNCEPIESVKCDNNVGMVEKFLGDHWGGVNKMSSIKSLRRKQTPLRNATDANARYAWKSFKGLFISEKTKLAFPKIPLPPIVTPISSSVLAIKWKDEDDSIDKFVLEYKQVPSDGDEVMTKFGRATLCCIRKDGIATHSLHDWKLDNGGIVNVFIPVKDICFSPPKVIEKLHDKNSVVKCKPTIVKMENDKCLPDDRFESKEISNKKVVEVSESKVEEIKTFSVQSKIDTRPTTLESRKHFRLETSTEWLRANNNVPIISKSNIGLPHKPFLLGSAKEKATTKNHTFSISVPSPLLPTSRYCVRLSSHNSQGWSHWSSPSLPVYTLSLEEEENRANERKRKQEERNVALQAQVNMESREGLVFSVVFDSGPLGLSLKGGSVGGTSVARTKPNGQAECHGVQVNDVVVGVGDETILDEDSVEIVVAKVKAHSRPVKIRFLRKTTQVSLNTNTSMSRLNRKCQNGKKDSTVDENSQTKHTEKSDASSSKLANSRNSFGISFGKLGGKFSKLKNKIMKTETHPTKRNGDVVGPSERGLINISKWREDPKKRGKYKDVEDSKMEFFSCLSAADASLEGADIDDSQRCIFSQHMCILEDSEYSGWGSLENKFQYRNLVKITSKKLAENVLIFYINCVDDHGQVELKTFFYTIVNAMKRRDCVASIMTKYKEAVQKESRLNDSTTNKSLSP